MSNKTDHPGVVVLGGHVQALGIIRIFGRMGIRSAVIDATKFNIARKSKYCDHFYLIPDCELLSFLMRTEIINKFLGWIIFPTNDSHVKILSENKKLLEENYIVSTDSWDYVMKFFNKKATYQLAEKIGIPIPKTYFPSTEKDIEQLNIEYPCIVKPAIMYTFYSKVKKKVFLCNTKAELYENYRRALKIIPPDEIIIQEVVKGLSKNQYSACFLFIDGISYVHLTACRMRQHPIDFGNATTYAETVNIPLLKEYGEKILRHSGYSGICEVEFKRDEKDGAFKFLEVNPRTWKWHSISNKAGTPFLPLFYQYLTGSLIQPIDHYEKASFRHALTDFPIQIQLLAKGLKYALYRSRPVEKAVWARDDIKPWFFEKIYLPLLMYKR